MAVSVSPILEPDLPRVAEFLHRELNGRLSPQAWQASMRVPWSVDAPNFGYLLESDSAVVGAYLAFYSSRLIDGAVERFCNLGAWCVLPPYRFSGLRLLKALLDQPGYHFTDLSPSGSVVPLNQRLGFAFLETETALAPNLPWPTLPGGPRVSSDPRVIEASLSGEDLRRYRDHVGTAAARHLVVTDAAAACHVVFRRDRRRNLPLFATILYVSDRDLFGRAWPAVSRHLLVRHAIPVTLAETRVVGRRPRASLSLAAHRRKMYRSTGLKPDQIDYLYSELVCVDW
ncbi:MAG TPA: hypothetical protein VH561_15390 [Micromonosporaceae bacterium]